MLTKELISNTAAASGLSRRRTEELLSATVSTLADCLRDGQSVQLQGFGTLELRQTNPRTTVHPRTKERIVTPAKMQLTFKPSVALKDELKNI